MANYRLGLDICATGGKVAVFEGRGKKARLVRFEKLDMAAEGFLDDAELLANLPRWLGEKGLAKAPVVTALPQFLVTTKVADFPKMDKGMLKKAVAQETQTVAGFSNEAMATGFVSMKAGRGRTNPTLIMLSMESAVQSRVGALTEAHVNCVAAAPSGLALANACFDLEEGVSSDETPMLLLDLGKENTTATIIAGGQVLYMGTLMFASSQFESAATAMMKLYRRNMDQQTPLSFLSEISLDTELGQSEILKAARNLETEIQEFVEQWRSQEIETLAQTPIGRVYISGGGSQLNGLVHWLTERLEAEVRILAPQDAGGQLCPEMTIAYGMGLQACGKALYMVNLQSEMQANTQLRARRWPFLVAACVVALAGIYVPLITSWVKTASAALEKRQQKKEMDQYVRMAYGVLDSQEKVRRTENLLRKISGSAMETRRLVETMNILSGISDGTLWAVSLSDGNTARTFQKSFFTRDQGDSDAEKRRANMGEALSDENTEYAILDGTDTMQHDYVLTVLTVGRQQKSFGTLLENLNKKKPFFSSVDRLPEEPKFVPMYLAAWRNYLNRNRGELERVLGLDAQARKERKPASPMYSMYFNAVSVQMVFPDRGNSDDEED